MKKHLMYIVCAVLLGIIAVLGSMVYYAANGGWPAKQESEPVQRRSSYGQRSEGYMSWSYSRPEIEDSDINLHENITQTATRSTYDGWAIGNIVMHSWQEYQDVLQQLQQQVETVYTSGESSRNWPVILSKYIDGRSKPGMPFSDSELPDEAFFDRYNLVLVDIQCIGVDSDVDLLGTSEYDETFFVGIGLDCVHDLGSVAYTEQGTLYWLPVHKGFETVKMRYFHTYTLTTPEYPSALPEDDP